MLRLRVAALLTFACAGCLEPLTSDEPGYSRHLLPANGEAPSGYDDTSINRKIDMGDGITGGKATPKPAWAAGHAVRYWDLGTARTTALPAYALAHCDGEGKPLANGVIDHPLLIDSLPTDPDYTQFWAINYACVTPKYQGQRVTSLAALSDAYEMGLLIEPSAPLAFKHGPVVSQGVVLEEAPPGVGTAHMAYYRESAVEYLDFGAQGDVVATMGKNISAGNVYELVRPGSTKVERVVFASAAFKEDGTRSDKYTPAWTIITVTIGAMTDITTFVQESDIGTQNMDKTFTKASDAVVSITATQNRAARPIVFEGVEQ
jgi:hypothetical protein